MTRTRMLGVAASLGVLIAPGIRAQAPAGVRFTLAAKDGKTSFRLGEPVEVEFRFEAATPRENSVWIQRPYRQARLPEFDRFTVERLGNEPADAVADPLPDIFVQSQAPAGINGQPPRPVPLTGAPITIGLQVNEWISIRKPGRYRITAETTRLVATAQPSTAVPLRSNSIQIEVVTPEAGWAAAQLEQAVALLQIPDPPPTRIGESVRAGVLEARQANGARAARTLRFLETPEAARELARFFDHGPQAAQSELHAGLFASPHRKEVMSAMEDAVAAPEIAITYYYLAALMELAELTRLGPLPLFTAKTPEEMRRRFDEIDGPYREKAKPVEAEYFTKLADAVGHKQGQALAVSLETLVLRGPQPTPPATAKALAANFQQLPENSQQRFLTDEWNRIASPALAPILQSIAASGGDLRDSALRRLEEFDPEAARKITLERIQKVDLDRERYRSYRVLLDLPDKTLPTADNALATALEQNKPQAEILVARYASEAVLPRLKAWVDQQPQRMCSPVLPTYFFRVDAAWASAALARVRQNGRGACAINVSPNEDLLMSPGLEKQALEDLSNPDLTIRRAAMTLLQYGGSAAAEKALLEAFARLRGEPGDSGESVKPGESVDPGHMLRAGMEQFFVTSLVNAAGWLPGEDAFTQITLYCATDPCRKQVASARKLLTPPISIDVSPVPVEYNGFRMGLIDLHSLKQAADKIAQFPKGTPFFITGSGPGSWYYEQRTAIIRKALEDAGMKIVDRPAPTPR
jgi:hypothetical protein